MIKMNTNDDNLNDIYFIITQNLINTIEINKTTVATHATLNLN